MEAYTSFARVYDLFMDNVPYEKWCDFIDAMLKKYGIRENIVLDLGCGTGKMTRIMEAKGYDMIGVDYSSEMLDIAREASYAQADAQWTEEADEEAIGPGEDSGEDCGTETGGNSEEEFRELAKQSQTYDGVRTPTLYLCQDMRELELYGTIGACYCSCDSLNYLLEEADIRKVFELVNNYLYPEGLFIFDINTPYKYEKLLAENTIAENRPQGSFIWENYYDPGTRINEYDLTLYIREDLLEEEEECEWCDEDLDGSAGEESMEEAGQPAFYRFRETHLQKCYDPQTICRLLEEAGMELIGMYDSYTEDPIRPDSEKITFIAREKGKKNV